MLDIRITELGQKLEQLGALIKGKDTWWSTWGRPVARTAVVHAAGAGLLWGLGLPLVDAVRWGVLVTLAYAAVLLPVGVVLAVTFGVLGSQVQRAAETLAAVVKR